MSDSVSVDEEIDLVALARRLTVVGMPAQGIIARETGVSQSTVSRASQGLIKTASESALRLWAYTSGRLEVIASTPTARAASPPTGGATGKPRRKPQRRRQPDYARAADVAALSKSELQALAVAGLKDYLADAFDPLLVIEQLSVLRRAQDRGAR